MIDQLRTLPAVIATTCRRGLQGIRQTPHLLAVTFHWITHIISFSFLLLAYLFHRAATHVINWRIFVVPNKEGLKHANERLFLKVTSLNRGKESTINRINLIDIAMRNMMFKKSRAAVTVGGMAIGVGAIVFLVSLGFGLQELVSNRVARLEERKQADVSIKPGSKEHITDETVAAIQQISGVEKTLPVIASVARVTFQNSASDMAVYGVTSEYLRQSDIQPNAGKIYESDEVASAPTTGQVAGASTPTEPSSDDPPTTAAIEFLVDEGAWIKVRAQPNREAKLLGYTRRGTGSYQGSLVWGSWYPEADSNMTSETEAGKLQARWVQAQFPLYEKQTCDVAQPDCVAGEYLVKKDASDQPLLESGYTAIINVSLLNQLKQETGQVLGESTEDDASDSGDLALVTTESTQIAGLAEEVSAIATSLSATPAAITSIEGNGDWVEIASESAATTTENITKTALPSSAKKQAVINMAMARILGLTESDAVGKSFTTSFIVVGDLLNEGDGRVESIPTDYTIVGVIPNDKVPFFYVPFADLRGLGVSKYSQLKIVTDQESSLAPIRKQIESLGFSSASVADTISQIESLFATIRLILVVLGMIALSIAALGMFNTLTVSLLERTREVGLMKALGMKSQEVQELFLTESMVMGFFGGILGIALGIVAGKSISLLLSAYSLSKGSGWIDVSYVPIQFIIFVFFLSLLVGVLTGVYPARRATRISALDALRYE